MSNFIRLSASERDYVPQRKKTFLEHNYVFQFTILLAKCKINLLNVFTRDYLRPWKSRTHPGPNSLIIIGCYSPGFPEWSLVWFWCMFIKMSAAGWLPCEYFPSTAKNYWLCIALYAINISCVNMSRGSHRQQPH